MKYPEFQPSNRKVFTQREEKPFQAVWLPQLQTSAAANSAASASLCAAGFGVHCPHQRLYCLCVHPDSVVTVFYGSHSAGHDFVYSSGMPIRMDIRITVRII